jgi:hypothetical protein
MSLFTLRIPAPRPFSGFFMRHNNGRPFDAEALAERGGAAGGKPPVM